MIIPLERIRCDRKLSFRIAAGLIAPALLPVSAFLIDRFLWGFINSPIEVMIGMALVGVVTGLLLRGAWAGIYAPAVLSGCWLAAASIAGGSQGVERTPTEVSILIAAVVALSPLIAGAFIAGALGQIIDQVRPSDGSHS